MNMKAIMEIISYREMLLSLVKKDLRVRYKGSFLGFLWTLINPLMQLVVYSIVFPYLMRVQEKNYAMFLFVALVPWIFFSTSIQASSTTIIGNSNLVKKIYFPRMILPVSIATSGLINCLLTLLVVFAGLLVSGIGITLNIMFLPLIILLEYIIVIGLSLIFSSLNVYFRDLEHILGIIIMVWFYLTPILYKTTMLPPKIAYYLSFNPMTSITNAYRNILYYGIMPDFRLIGYTLIFSLVLLVAGILIFTKLEKRFAEEV